MENTSHKILVVDDDPRLRDLLRRYLGEQGFTVLVAENATAMNKLWLRERFDLLVLDLMMEPEDGLTICRRLRAEGHDIRRLQSGLEASGGLDKDAVPSVLTERVIDLPQRVEIDE